MTHHSEQHVMNELAAHDNVRPVPLSMIDLAHSPCVRSTVDPALITEYAKRMVAGDVFPPVVVFCAGARLLLADGFHRVRAALRNGAVLFPAEVRTGSYDEALWHALGANCTHGARLTSADQRRAIRLAIETWPDRSNRELAVQIGVAHQRVSEVRCQLAESGHVAPRLIGRDGKTYPATNKHDVAHPKVADIEARLGKGETRRTIAKDLHVSEHLVTETRKRLTASGQHRTRAASAECDARIRAMAEAGYTSHQIAAAVGIGFQALRNRVKAAGLTVRADIVVGKPRAHDPNRIVSRMVMQAENLCGDTNLIEFARLDPAQLPQWVTSLEESRRSLSAFINRLKQEQRL